MVTTLKLLLKLSKKLKLKQKNQSIIEVKTIIGFGAEKQGTSAVHGAPLGVDGIAYAKKTYGWEYPEFTVPEEVAKRFEVGIKFRGEAAQNAWETKFREYEAAYPEN